MKVNVRTAAPNTIKIVMDAFEPIFKLHGSKFLVNFSCINLNFSISSKMVNKLNAAQNLTKILMKEAKLIFQV